MEITVTIKTPELAAAIEKLAAAIEHRHMPTVTVADAPTIVQGGELQIPAGADLTVADATRDNVTLTAAPDAETITAAAKPKRARKTAAKAPESTQDSAEEPEAAKPERVTTAQEKPAESAPEAAETAPTLDQIAAAGAKLLDDDPNAMDGLLAALSDFGVQAVTQLKTAQLAGFAARLRELGAEV